MTTTDLVLLIFTGLCIATVICLCMAVDRLSGYVRRLDDHYNAQIEELQRANKEIKMKTIQEAKEELRTLSRNWANTLRSSDFYKLMDTTIGDAVGTEEGSSEEKSV